VFFILDKAFFVMTPSASAYSNFTIRTVSSAAITGEACMIVCFFSTDCHFTIVVGTLCLIGNFKKSPISYGYSSPRTTYVFKGFWVIFY
jgi:hypothetical protein